MKKVKNILKGYANQFDIEEITVFDTDDQVVYSGSYAKFMDTKEEDRILWTEWNRIMNSDCKKCIPFNHSKLFIFLYHHNCSDCKNLTDAATCKYGFGYICNGKRWESKS